MFTKSRERLRDAEEGFTLIELLVVVIIIGILAAIAIPTFLNQRERGWQAELTSGVRNGALDIEAAATAANGTYPPATDISLAGSTPVELGDLDGPNGEITFYYQQVGSGTGFTLCGNDSRINSGSNAVTYDTANGGLGEFSESGTCAGTAVT